jgi:AraC-like DNA-binding protein
MSVRITGLVTASNRVREQLKVGISAQHVDQFRQGVLTALRTTEQLCAQARMTPAQLPTPSRKAYAFLKQIDLKHLPIADASLPESAFQTITLRNVRGQKQYIQSEISKFVEQVLGKGRLPRTSTTIQPLCNALLHKVSEIEKICSQNGLSPAHLAGTSKTFYAWMQYLLEGQHLLAHLEAMQRFQQILQALDRPHLPKGFGKAKGQPVSVKPVSLELTNMAALYRFRSTPKTTQVELSEGFIAADDQVWNALAQVIHSGKSPETTKIITQFSCSEEFSEILLAINLIVGDIADTVQGHAHNLETIFHKVHQDYFDKTFQKPQLAWSKTFTHRKYGHYEPARDRVVLSRTLDDSRIPSYVVEFVMYHELLHKRHGAIWVNGRLRVHTPAFRHDERQFKQYDLAQAFFQRLAVQ